MAKQKKITWIDDLDGTEAEENVPFGFGGSDYEIDLSAENAEAFRVVMRPYLIHGRPVVRKHRRRRHRSAVWTDPQKVRGWAEAHGIEVNYNGYPRQDVVKRYLQAWINDELDREFM